MANRKPTDQKGIELRNNIRQAKASGNSGAFRQAQDAYSQYRGRATGPQTGGALRNINPKNAKSLIRAQQEENANVARETNMANNANISGPGANRTITYDESGQPTVNVSMGDQEKALYDKFMKMAGDGVDFSALPALPGDFSQDRQRVEDELYTRESGRLDKQFSRAEEDFNRQMSNRGVPLGSELYNKLKGDFENQRQQAYSGARQNAIQTAGAESQRLFGNQLASRQQGFTELEFGRTNPLKAFGGLMTLGADLSNSMGGFQGTQRAPTDVAGISLGVEGLRRGGGGGTSQADYLARLNASTQAQKDLMAYGQELNKQNKPKQPGFGDAAASAGGGFLGSFFGGLGDAAGSALGGSWFD